MTMRLGSLLALAGVTISGEPSMAETKVFGDHCEITRILADGRRVVTPPKAVAASGTVGHSFAATSSSTGSTRSSVSASASSNGRSGTSSSTSSSTDANGRKITITQDNDGCRVVIDERNVVGAKR